MLYHMTDTTRKLEYSEIVEITNDRELSVIVYNVKKTNDSS